MHISARSDYAVRAALGLAAKYPATVSSASLATEQDLPRKFLEAILADLRRAGLVRGQLGVEGGYVLTRQPERRPHRIVATRRDMQSSSNARPMQHTGASNPNDRRGSFTRWATRSPAAGRITT